MARRSPTPSAAPSRTPSAILKEALKGDDAEAIKAKTNTLAQASMKLGEAMYKQQAESDAAKDAAKDDVVDANLPRSTTTRTTRSLLERLIP